MTPPGTDRFSNVHPDVARVASRLRQAGLIPPKGGDVKDVRDYLERITGFVAASSVPLTGERRLGFPVDGRHVPCKLYWPDSSYPPGLMFYCHGGGFRHGALAGWDAPLRQLVRESGVAVLSIEYALAPEYPFPHGVLRFNELAAVVQDLIRVEGEALLGSFVE